MADSFHVEILGPDKIIYSAQASSLVVPAEYGYLGVLANHAPLIARLVEGRITVRGNDGKTQVFEIRQGGFIEVLKNRATLIVAAETRV